MSVCLSIEDKQQKSNIRTKYQTFPQLSSESQPQEYLRPPSLTPPTAVLPYLAPAVDAEIKGVLGAPGAVLHPGVEGHHGSSSSGSAGEGAEVLPLGGLPLVHIALVGKAVVLGALHGAEVSAAGGTGVEVA